MSKRDAWNARYAASELVWGAEPNRFVAEALGDAPARGRALDLACGEGRNALWLASLGWRVTAVDFSAVALSRGAERAAAAGVEVDFVEADVTRWQPEPGAYALVLIAYLQLPRPEFQRALRAAARAVAPGGELFAIGHHLRNLQEGVGGPQDPDVLWEPDALAADLRGAGLQVLQADGPWRPVEGRDRPALDARLRARRPPEVGAQRQARPPEEVR